MCYIACTAPMSNFGVCRYVVCRDCRTTFEENRAKERRLKRRLNEPISEENVEED